MAAFRFVVLIVMGAAGWCLADFIVRNPITGSTTRYPTASYTFLSLDDGKMHSNQPAVFVQAGTLCEPTRALVAGKIVVADLSGTRCWLNDAAMQFKELGAIACVFLVSYSPPGMLSNLHWTLDPDKESAGLPVVDVTRIDIGNEEFTMWQASSMSGFSATLTPDHTRLYQETFESQLWIFLMQVVLPCCALVVSAESVRELIRRLFASSRKGATDLMLTVEAASCIAIAGALALGEYGPLLLPCVFHLALLALLSGCSLFTTILLTIIIHEKARAFKGSPQRDVLAYYPRSVAACAIVFISWDVVVGVLMANEPSAASYENVTRVAGMYGVGKGAVGVYFFVKARALKQALLAYSDVQETPRSEISAQIARVTFCLDTSVASMLLGTASFVSVASSRPGLYRAEGSLNLFCLVFVFSASRIAISYCLVNPTPACPHPQ